MAASSGVPGRGAFSVSEGSTCELEKHGGDST